jgi:hypothetical protein
VRDSITIVQITPIVTNAQTNYNVTCPGDNITLNSSFSGGYPPFSVVWSTGATTSSITVTPNATGTYTYTVSDSCSSLPSTQTITVNVPSAPPISATVTSNDILPW